MKNINGLSKSLNDHMGIKEVVKHGEPMEDIQFDMNTTLLGRLSQLEQKIEDVEEGLKNNEDNGNDEIDLPEGVVTYEDSLEDIQFDVSTSLVDKVVQLEQLVNEKVNDVVQIDDLNAYQEKVDENLVTESKDLVGAINELFQNVDSGKGIIADAIDDENITKDSTFAAMGEAIEELQEQIAMLSYQVMMMEANAKDSE